MATIVITAEMAKNAANEVRNYMNAGESCRGINWVEKTFNLAYILQEWIEPFNGEQHPNDYIEEYRFIHSASTHNWHTYEDPEY